MLYHITLLLSFSSTIKATVILSKHFFTLLASCAMLASLDTTRQEKQTFPTCDCRMHVLVFSEPQSGIPG